MTALIAIATGSQSPRRKDREEKLHPVVVHFPQIIYPLQGSLIPSFWPAYYCDLAGHDSRKRLLLFVPGRVTPPDGPLDLPDPMEMGLRPFDILFYAVESRDRNEGMLEVSDRFSGLSTNDASGMIVLHLTNLRPASVRYRRRRKHLSECG